MKAKAVQEVSSKLLGFGGPDVGVPIYPYSYYLGLLMLRCALDSHHKIRTHCPMRTPPP